MTEELRQEIAAGVEDDKRKVASTLTAARANLVKVQRDYDAADKAERKAWSPGADHPRNKEAYAKAETARDVQWRRLAAQVDAVRKLEARVRELDDPEVVERMLTAREHAGTKHDWRTIRQLEREDPIMAAKLDTQRKNTIAKMVTMREAGMGYPSIAKKLNDDKVPTFGGGKTWYTTVVRSILIGHYGSVETAKAAGLATRESEKEATRTAAAEAKAAAKAEKDAAKAAKAEASKTEAIVAAEQAAHDAKNEVEPDLKKTPAKRNRSRSRASAAKATA